MEQAITARMSFTVMAAMDTAIHTARDQAPRTTRKGSARYDKPRPTISPPVGRGALSDLYGKKMPRRSGAKRTRVQFPEDGLASAPRATPEHQASHKEKAPHRAGLKVS